MPLLDEPGNAENQAGTHRGTGPEVTSPWAEQEAERPTAAY